MTHTITFIQDPLFYVDFDQFIKPTPQQKEIQTAALNALDGVKFVFNALVRSGYLTLSHASDSFKYTVLGIYNGHLNRRQNLHLAALKTIFWIVGMAWCFITTTVRIVYNHAHDNTSSRSRHADEEIDVAHMNIAEISIDVSSIPKTVSVNDLLPLFDEINFNDPQAPGYMAPGCRREGDAEYTVKQLKISLQTFVDHVNGRVAFLGTPPSYDMDRLMKFYQQIEDAVRFSIHKVNEDLEQFGSNPESADPRIYKNLLENRARAAINLAIAGLHCGARYMGESMELYYSLQGGSVIRGTLKDSLADFLAYKRKEIADKQFAIYFQPDTHNYNAYMGNLGPILGIPGTEHVIEHLKRFDKDLYLEKFFEEYTADFILNSIQEKVKKSQLFREKITDWICDQMGSWRPRDEIDPDIERAQDTLPRDEQIIGFPIYENFLLLQRMIADLHQRLPALDPVMDRNGFVERLFEPLAVNHWLISIETDVTKRLTLKQNLKSLFSDDQLGGELSLKVTQAISGNSELSLKDFTPQILILKKTSSLCKALGLRSDCALRVVKGDLGLEEAINYSQAVARRSRFLEQLNLHTMAETGLSQEILEWIVVSQGILKPQE